MRPVQQCLVCRHKRDFSCLAVAKTPGTPHTRHGGRDYWFCGESCRCEFEKHPQPFLPKLMNHPGERLWLPRPSLPPSPCHSALMPAPSWLDPDGNRGAVWTSARRSVVSSRMTARFASLCGPAMPQLWHDGIDSSPATLKPGIECGSLTPRSRAVRRKIASQQIVRARLQPKPAGKRSAIQMSTEDHTRLPNPPAASTGMTTRRCRAMRWSSLPARLLGVWHVAAMVRHRFGFGCKRSASRSPPSRAGCSFSRQRSRRSGNAGST